MKQVIALLVTVGLWILCGWVLIHHSTEVEGVKIICSLGLFAFGAAILFQLYAMYDD